MTVQEVFQLNIEKNISSKKKTVTSKMKYPDYLRYMREKWSRGKEGLKPASYMLLI